MKAEVEQLDLALHFLEHELYEDTDDVGDDVAQMLKDARRLAQLVVKQHGKTQALDLLIHKVSEAIKVYDKSGDHSPGHFISQEGAGACLRCGLLAVLERGKESNGP